jgi:hypothetical protein
MIPLIVYGDYDPVTQLGGTELNFSLIQSPWGHRSLTIGGFEKSSAGVPETWTQYREKQLIFQPKITEAERVLMETWIDWCHDNGAGPFLFLHDQSLARAAAVPSYLEEPMQGATFDPPRGSYYGTWEPVIVIRRVDGAPWDISYF